ncbi:MAG TPA: MIP/aquaporin family protein [Actinomycetota bacterium]|jgi:glycerol uptake facilitator protein|nr:MIP/aquaporin family protein [Actinomycetota bacterium]
MFAGEVVGTAVLILLGDGVVAGVLLNRSKAQNGGWIVITWAWAMAVFMGVITSLAVTGGVAHLNPAVTIGLAAIGATDWADVPKLIAGQFIGAFIGATLVYLSYLPHWAETEDKGLKLAVFSTGPAIRNTVSNVITEVVGTAMLVFGVAAIAIKLGGGFVVSGASGMSVGGALATGALPVGLLVLVIGLSLGGPTGYAINPARDLGPRIMHFILPIAGKGDSDWAYSWIPVVGPIIGGVIGGFLAKWAFDLKF